MSGGDKRNQGKHVLDSVVLEGYAKEFGFYSSIRYLSAFCVANRGSIRASLGRKEVY